jgi:hypothetical protein
MLLLAGIVFTVCCEPYLESEYGSDYISETPVKLLDRLLYGQRQHLDEEVCAAGGAVPNPLLCMVLLHVHACQFSATSLHDGWPRLRHALLCMQWCSGAVLHVPAVQQRASALACRP